MQLSIVIPLYKSSRHLPRLVERLSATAGDAEIVFVDDASGDGTLKLATELAAANFPGTSQVLALPENLGVFGARKSGVEAARGDFVTLVDADDDWDDDYFAELLDRLPESSADVILRPIKSRVPGAPQFHLVSGDWTGMKGRQLTPAEMMRELALNHLGFSGIWGRAIRREVALETWTLEAAYPSFVDNDNNLLWRLYHLAAQGVELLDGAAYIWDQNLASTRYQPQYRQGILQDKVQSICALEDWLKPVIAPDLWAVLLGRWAIELQANLFDAPSLSAVLTDPAGWREFLANLRRDHPEAARKAEALITSHFSAPRFRTAQPCCKLHVVTIAKNAEELMGMADRMEVRPDIFWWAIVPEGTQPPPLPVQCLFSQDGVRPEDLALEHIQDGHVVIWPPDAGWQPSEVMNSLGGRAFDSAKLEWRAAGTANIWSRSLIGSDRWRQGGTRQAREGHWWKRSRSKLLIRLQTKSESPPVI
jgi:hypothetical protein